MEKLSKMGCNLYIDTINEPPEIITEITSVEASELQVKGTLYKNSQNQIIEKRKYKHNLWILNSPFFYGEHNVYLNNSIEYIISILNDNKAEFLEVLNRFPDNHLLCYSYYYEVNPYFILTSKLIEELSVYKVPIEFDFYLLNK
jgi:hypothetical protein